MVQLIKTPFNAGTLAGLALFIVFVLAYYIGMHPMLTGQMLFIPVTITAIVMTLLRVKNRLLGGKITFRRAFYTGVVVSFVSVSLCCLLGYIFVSLVAHDFLENYFTGLEFVTKVNEENGFSLLDVNVDEMREKVTLWVALQGLFFNGFFFSTAVSLVVALIVKNQRWKPGIENIEG